MPEKRWGAVCNGVGTEGPWTPEERTMHINCLELLAAFLAVKCFAKDRTNLTIHLKMNSMSALTYINKLGGTISPARGGPPTSRVGYLWQCYQVCQVFEGATKLLLVSWRQKSSKMYDSLFGKWVSWCRGRDSDPVSCSISD